MEMILGMAGALLAVILFGVGGLCGWVLRGKTERPREAQPQELTEEEKRKREALIKEQEAFRKMMSYNQEAAYGMSGTGGDG